MDLRNYKFCRYCKHGIMTNTFKRQFLCKNKDSLSYNSTIRLGYSCKHWVLK